MTTLSMDGTDPATWDPALDGVLAAPENHTVLYEDEAIRVISVSIAPGAIEKPHHHCLPAVFVVDRLVSVRDFNGATGAKIRSAPTPPRRPHRLVLNQLEFGSACWPDAYGEFISPCHMGVVPVPDIRTPD
jgi:hypothetical protein